MSYRECDKKSIFHYGNILFYLDTKQEIAMKAGITIVKETVNVTTTRDPTTAGVTWVTILFKR